MFLRVAVAIGLCVDTVVAVLALFFQPLLGPLFDIPVKDPALTTIAGGEYVVVALVYALVLRDPGRFHPLLWLCAIDQAFAAFLPAVEIGRGNVVASWKTIGPIPLNALLAVCYAVLAARAPDTRSARPPAECTASGTPK
jgi:hypothetical protein